MFVKSHQSGGLLHRSQSEQDGTGGQIAGGGLSGSVPLGRFQLQPSLFSFTTHLAVTWALVTTETLRHSLIHLIDHSSRGQRDFEGGLTDFVCACPCVCVGMHVVFELPLTVTNSRSVRRLLESVNQSYGISTCIQTHTHTH